MHKLKYVHDKFKSYSVFTLFIAVFDY